MTELVWDGKYDKDGRRVAPVRIPLPFQTIETVNESAQVRAHQLDLFSQGRQTDWRNRLIWGDKKYVLPSLLPDFAGKVNLIYIDPPFATGADFSFTTNLPDTDETFTKEPNMIEQKAYRDTWGKGISSYLQWFYETAMLIRPLLAEDGSLYLHLDSHLGHYAKVILDEVFGAERFQSEIIWKRTSAHSSAQRYGPVHDSLFYYTTSDNSTWTDARADYDQAYLDKYYRFDDGDGRLYWRADLCAAGVRTGKSGLPWRGIDPGKKGMHWKFGVDTLEELDAAGRIYWPPKGTMPQYKRYRDELKGKSLSDVWDDIDRINPVGYERLGYPTQKPEALLERIIRASSNAGDLVLDCFCGSGTTAAVAEKLGRRWIAADLGRFAIHTTRKRLLSIPNVRPFAVQNLGKYERQAWQVAEFAEGDARQSARVQLAYRRFMLDLYRAQPLDGYTWLHGVRDGRLVHVGGVDAPVSQGDVRGIVQEFWKVRAGSAAVNAVDVLGWDFAFELNEVATQMAAEANVRLRFKRIPREVLEKKAVEQGDIKFFELAALSVAVSQADRAGVGGVAREHGPHVTITLTDFTVPPDEVPDDVIRAVTNWIQWIDYWAVDWDYKGDAFHNMAQEYRTRKDPQLQPRLAHTYEQPGTYTVVVKVIDILGNDTTKSLTLEVR